MNSQKCLAALAGAFVAVEVATVCAVSLGLIQCSAIKAIASFARGLFRHTQPPPPVAAPPAPAPTIAGPKQQPEPAAPPVPEPSTSSLPSALASEPTAEPSALAQHALDCQPSEISFCFSNALVGTSGDEDAGSDSLAACEEGEEEEEEAFEDCNELVFEPASTGCPGMRMLPRGISGIAIRTDPTAADTGSPLLVSNYESRFVEVINGRVKQEAGIEPAYVPLSAEGAAHSPPRRSASRAGSPLGHLSGVSPSPSSLF